MIEILKEYGDIGQDLLTRIKGEADLKVLSKWVKLAAKVNSIDEFVAKMDD